MLGRLNMRQATQNDVTFVVKVLLLANEKRLSAREEWRAERFLKNVTASTQKEVDGKVANSTTYVIEYDNVQVGRLRIVRPGNEIHIAGIQVHPKYQGKGIGSQVIRAMMKDAKEKKWPLTLEVEKDNPDAKRLYIKLGFEVTKDRGDREFMTLG